MTYERKKIRDLYRSIIFNVISATIIVLSWYIIYHVFRNYQNSINLSSQKKEALNIIAFFGVYFFIELINYCFNNQMFRYYVITQIFLDGCLFLLLGEILRGKVFFVPSNSVDNQYVVFKSYIDYFQQYGLSFICSNVIMLYIHGIRIFVKSLKEK